MTEERRREARKKEGNRVTIETALQNRADDDTAPTKKISFSITEDISLKGIKVISETFFPVDTLLKIDLSLAELLEPLRLQGKVKWIRSHEGDLYEIGIEFIDASPEQMKTLVDHMYKYEEEF
ncbi:MAG: PilZ domain-containing protein [Candidatus Aminicenantes bacterium]